MQRYILVGSYIKSRRKLYFGTSHYEREDGIACIPTDYNTVLLLVNADTLEIKVIPTNLFISSGINLISHHLHHYDNQCLYLIHAWCTPNTPELKRNAKQSADMFKLAGIHLLAGHPIIEPVGTMNAYQCAIQEIPANLDVLQIPEGFTELIVNPQVHISHINTLICPSTLQQFKDTLATGNTIRVNTLVLNSNVNIPFGSNIHIDRVYAGLVSNVPVFGYYERNNIVVSFENTLYTSLLVLPEDYERVIDAPRVSLMCLREYEGRLVEKLLALAIKTGKSYMIANVSDTETGLLVTKTGTQRIYWRKLIKQILL